MTKIDIQIHENVMDVYNKIKNINDNGIEIQIPEGSVLFENTINIKLLKKLIQKEDKVLSLSTEDEFGQTILNIVDDNYVLDTPTYISYEPKKPISQKFKSINLPSLPSFKGLKINFKVPKIGFILTILFIFGLILGGYYILNAMHTGSVKIVVESQTLSRSITVNVKKDEANDFENNIIKGYEVQQTIDSEKSINTTGEKTEGSKAKGEITIYNRTSSEKTFEKGEILILEDDDKEYRYLITKDVTVPQREENDLDPEEPMVPGENKVEVEAEEIGEKYNFDKDKTLKFDDHNSSDYIAKNTSAFTGGETNLITVVAQKDIDDLNKEVTELNNNQIIDKLESSDTSNIKYIKGSQQVLVLEEDYSDELDEETEELTLKQTVTATGLSYSLEDLNNLIKNNIKTLVPEGFEILDQDTELNIEVLGNSSNSILNNNQADLQVTVRMYITPKIDEEELKNKVKGQNIQRAQEILSEINNIKTYQIEVYPNISFYNKFPGDINKISVSIEK